MSRAFLVSFLWGVAATIVAAPVAGFLALLTFARVVVADTRQFAGTEDSAVGRALRRPRVIPIVIFAVTLLLLLWLAAYIWPSARQVPAYPAGALTGLAALGILTWMRGRPRRSGDGIFPAQGHPGAIQYRFTQDLHEAVAQGRVPAGLRGELTVVVESDDEGHVIDLSIQDPGSIPAPIRTVAERTLSGIHAATPGGSIRQFILRY
jgi:hypothetical protein